MCCKATGVGCRSMKMFHLLSKSSDRLGGEIRVFSLGRIVDLAIVSTWFIRAGVNDVV